MLGVLLIVIAVVLVVDSEHKRVKRVKWVRFKTCTCMILGGFLVMIAVLLVV